jgi:hypothetical protein
MNFKKIIYIICTIVLCLLLASIAHSLIEMWYIEWLLARSIAPTPGALGYRCFLPLPLAIFLPLAAIVGGWFLGNIWWRIIYVERRFAKRKFIFFKRNR